MAKYIKKPVIIEAFQVGIDNYPDWFKPEWLIIDGNFIKGNIKTLEGIMSFSQGDYIIKGIKGEVYPCKKDIFEETYLPVKEW